MAFDNMPLRVRKVEELLRSGIICHEPGTNSDHTFRETLSMGGATQQVYIVFLDSVL